MKATFILFYSFFTSGVSVFAQYDQQLSSRAFGHEIARLAVTVDRLGSKLRCPFHLSQLKTGDILRVRMIDQSINGISSSRSFWDWTLVFAYVNPNRNISRKDSVSREINFRRHGWAPALSRCLMTADQCFFFTQSGAIARR